MASVYILYSKEKDKYYIGSCLELNHRLKLHKDKTFKNSYTTISSDWEVYLHIDGLTHEKARKIETHIKKMKSKVYIQNLIKYPEITIKLKETL